MKNAFLVLLSVALGVCLIWGCTVHSEKDALEKEKAQLERQHQILQLLYTQTQKELDQARETAAEESADSSPWQSVFIPAENAFEQALPAKETALPTEQPAAEPADAASQDGETEALFTVPSPQDADGGAAPTETLPVQNPVTQETEASSAEGSAFLPADEPAEEDATPADDAEEETDGIPLG